MRKRFLLILPLLFGLFSCSNKGKEVTYEVFNSKIDEVLKQEKTSPQTCKYSETVESKNKLRDKINNSLTKTTVDYGKNGYKKNEILYLNKKSDDSEYYKSEEKESIAILNNENTKFDFYFLEKDKNDEIRESYKINSNIDDKQLNNFEELKYLISKRPLKSYTDFYLNEINSLESEGTQRKYFIYEKNNIINFSCDVIYEPTNIMQGMTRYYTLEINNGLMTKFTVKSLSKSKDGAEEKSRERKVELSTFDGEIKVRTDIVYPEY